jgi:hypothetical protein
MNYEFWRKFCGSVVLQFCSFAVLQLGYPVRDILSVEKSSAVLWFSIDRAASAH